MSRPISLATKMKVEAFIAHHKSDFAEALAETKAAKRSFLFSAVEFDRWAVAEGLMEKALEDVKKGDKVARAGVRHQRHEVRLRLNRCSVRWDGQPSAFVIQARNGLWNVALIERFLVEQPREVLFNIRQAFSRAQYSLEQVQVLLRTRLELSVKEKALCLTQVGTAMEYVSDSGVTVDMMLRKVMIGHVSPEEAIRVLNLSRPKRAIM
jgi:hypothetical protein